jgi:hypothetical protein
MSWQVRARAVRQHELGLRWTLEAATEDLTTTVTADTTYDGNIYDLQSDGYLGTSGDDALDFEVGRHIADVLALRNVPGAFSTLPAPERPFPLYDCWRRTLSTRSAR